MDLIQELRELVETIRAAAVDGRLDAPEILRILKELADVVQILYQVLGKKYGVVLGEDSVQ